MVSTRKMSRSWKDADGTWRQQQTRMRNEENQKRILSYCLCVATLS